MASDKERVRRWLGAEADRAWHKATQSEYEHLRRLTFLTPEESIRLRCLEKQRKNKGEIK